MGQMPVEGRHSPPDSLPLIRASELAQYSYCHRAWWLGTVKELPARSQSALDRGARHHARHRRQVYLARYWQRLGLVMLGCGFLLLLVVLFWLWM